MSTVRVIIQCRLASQRLSAKALLPVAGMPLFALCAKRAANTGLETILATADCESNKPLLAEIVRWGLPYFAGPENDVLSRFAQCAAKCTDNDIVVRLTADNILPDGPFIEELVGQMQARSLEYLGTSSPQDGLPYGLSAEAFTVRVLREAEKSAVLSHEREHVTPWIREKYCTGFFRPADARGDQSAHRCTIDTFSDYLKMAALFEKIQSPCETPWQLLYKKLVEESKMQIRVRANGTKRSSAITLGSAQWGLEYGRTNTSGIPTDAELADIVTCASSTGITTIDTASAYGNAEQRIGKLRAAHIAEDLSIVTKLDPFSGVTPDWSAVALQRAVDASVYKSCRELHLERLDTLLLHRWSHYSLCNGAIWQRLLELVEQGVIGRLGVSVQNTAEALEALAVDEVKHIQLPFNILDYRWREISFKDALTKRPDVIIHARSVFLQGILIAGPQCWPGIDGVDPLKSIAVLDELAKEFCGGSRKALCLLYALSQEWIDSCVTGIETAAQCKELTEIAAGAPFDTNTLNRIDSHIEKVPTRLLDPSQWSTSQ